MSAKEKLMNENIEKLMYDAGLTADGCFGDMDKYDQEAVMRVIDSSGVFRISPPFAQDSQIKAP